MGRVVGLGRGVGGWKGKWEGGRRWKLNRREGEGGFKCKSVEADFFRFKDIIPCNLRFVQIHKPYKMSQLIL